MKIVGPLRFKYKNEFEKTFHTKVVQLGKRNSKPLLFEIELKINIENLEIFEKHWGRFYGAPGSALTTLLSAIF